MLCTGGGVVYASSRIKTVISDHYSSLDDPSLSTTILYNVLSFLPSILVVLMNAVLTATIWYCERLALYSTVTDLQAAVARNLTLAMVINTALVAIPIHLNDWYGPKGLVVEVYNIMISNALVSPLMYLLSPGGIVKWIRVKLAVRQGNSCMLTQQEANELFEATGINMPNLCAGLMKTYLLSIMYAPLLPVGLFIGLVAIFLQYWTNKYMLLRRHCRPVRLSDELDEVMLRFVALGCVAYAASTCYFFYDLDSDLYLPGAVGCGIAGVYVCFPVHSLTKRLLKRKNTGATGETMKSYEAAAVDFYTDYDRANPVTAQEGTEWWVNLITRLKGTAQPRPAPSTTLRKFAKEKVPRAKQYTKQKLGDKSASRLKSTESTLVSFDQRRVKGQASV